MIASFLNWICHLLRLDMSDRMKPWWTWLWEWVQFYAFKPDCRTAIEMPAKLAVQMYFLFDFTKRILAYKSLSVHCISWWSFHAIDCYRSWSVFCPCVSHAPFCVQPLQYCSSHKVSHFINTTDWSIWILSSSQLQRQMQARAQACHAGWTQCALTKCPIMCVLASSVSSGTLTSHAQVCKRSACCDCCFRAIM